MSNINPTTELNAEVLKIIRSKTEYGLISFYENCFNWKFPPHLMAPVMALCDERIRNLMILVGPGSGKAVAYGTKILTETGWKAVETLQVGEFVYTPKGTLTQILAKWEQPKMPMYEILFKDGRVARVNGKHLWKVYWKKFNRGTLEYPWRIRETDELFRHKWKNSANSESSPRFYIPLTEPIPFSEQILPIDPYVLGCLLGDGCFVGGTPSFTTADQEIIERFKNSGICIGSVQTKAENKASSYGILNILPTIKKLNLFNTNSVTKFIPEIYKIASIEQRFELLRGLMDTDGTVGSKKHVSYCTVSPQLAKDVCDLIYSLGGIAKIGVKSAWYKNASGEKLNGKPAYNISIRFPQPDQLFNLQRKKDRAKNTQYSDNLNLEIMSIHQIADAESMCISVADPEGLFIIDDYVVTHNSQLLSVCFPAWNLGHNPGYTHLGISASEGLIQGFVQASMELIEWSPWYKVVFPDVKPDKDSGWSPLRGAYVTGRPKGLPDPSYVGAGLTSKTLTGKHGKVLILDDIHDPENSGTPEQCKRVIDKYYNQLIGRADPSGARFILAGRRWSIHDLYGYLIKHEADQWVIMTLPAERKNSSRLYWDISVPEGLECCFTENKE